MSEDAYFLHWKEAEGLVRGIADPTERLLMEAALNHAVGFLLREVSYTDAVASGGTRFDLLTFAESLRSFLRRQDVLRGILDGSIKSLDDLNPFAAAPPQGRQ